MANIHRQNKLRGLYGNKVKEYREARGLAQHELAEEWNTGQAQVSRWELGKTKPPKALMEKIDEYSGEPVDTYLVTKKVDDHFIEEEKKESLSWEEQMVEKIADRAVAKIIEKLNG